VKNLQGCGAVEEIRVNTPCQNGRRDMP